MAGGERAHSAPVKERLKYAAKNSTEAWLSFRYFVDYGASSDSEASAKRAIRKQLLHLYGPMGDGKQAGVPKGNHKLTNLRIERRNGAGANFRAHYTYRGKIAVEKGNDADYTVILPRNPATIYQASLDRDGFNPCTDEEYQGEEDFWYFWNPVQNAACQSLLKAGVHYDVLDARKHGLKLERIRNTTLSFPRYAKLVRRMGERGQKYIRMDVLFGMDDPRRGRNPWTSRDINAPNFRSIVELLEKRGFERARTWTKADFERLIREYEYEDPYVLEMKKETKSGITLFVRLFFGPSGIDEDSTAFHYFLKQAIETSSVLIYAGHSGLGGHLKLRILEQAYGFRIEPPRDQYQIYFMNGCTTYSYYNEMFFDRKATSADPEGTKNLEVVTNGLDTYFTVINKIDFYLFNAVANWAEGEGALSYQKLAVRSDSGNLYGVNGDEDNPTTEEDEEVQPPR